MSFPTAAEQRAQLLRDLASMSEESDPIPRERRALAHLYVVARPASPPVAAGALLRGVALRHLIHDALTGSQYWFPNLAELIHIAHYPTGALATADGPGVPAEREELQLLVTESGQFELISGQASRPVRGAQEAVVSARQLADLLHQLLDVLAAASRDHLHHDGDWLVGVRIEGLDGVLPSDVFAADTYLWQRFAPYPRDVYDRAVLVSSTQLQGSRPRIVEMLLGDLARGLGVAVFPYSRRADLSG